MTAADKRYTAASVERQVALVLQAWGMPRDTAEQAASILADADLAGIDSHGISMLPIYAVFVRRGKFDLAARPSVVAQGEAWALVDGGAGLGFAPSMLALEEAARRARKAGVAVVGVRNSHHFGAAGYYTAWAAARGFVALATTSTRVVSMVPAGGSRPMLGTNPIAFAAPARGDDLVCMDIATTTVANGKIKVHALRGQPLHEGWVVDARGRPVLDAREAFDIVYRTNEGGLTALGSAPQLGVHKGYALAIMGHVLAATLCGGAFAPLVQRDAQDALPDNVAHFFALIDIGLMRPAAQFRDELQAMLDALRATPPADPAQPVLVPGDLERRRRAERRELGIPLPAALVDDLATLATECGATWALEGA